MTETRVLVERSSKLAAEAVGQMNLAIAKKRVRLSEIELWRDKLLAAKELLEEVLER